MTYIHAEAFSAGELKHGPLALINPEGKIKVQRYLFYLNVFSGEINSSYSDYIRQWKFWWYEFGIEWGLKQRRLYNCYHKLLIEASFQQSGC